MNKVREDNIEESVAKSLSSVGDFLEYVGHDDNGMFDCYFSDLCDDVREEEVIPYCDSSLHDNEDVFSDGFHGVNNRFYTSANELRNTKTCYPYVVDGNSDFVALTLRAFPHELDFETTARTSSDTTTTSSDISDDAEYALNMTKELRTYWNKLLRCHEGVLWDNTDSYKALLHLLLNPLRNPIDDDSDIDSSDGDSRTNLNVKLLDGHLETALSGEGLCDDDLVISKVNDLELELNATDVVIDTRTDEERMIDEKLLVMRQIFEEEKEELRQQERRIQIDAYENTFYPEPEFESCSVRGGDDKFTISMRESGFSYRDSMNEDRQVTYASLPPALDISSFCQGPPLTPTETKESTTTVLTNQTASFCQKPPLIPTETKESTKTLLTNPPSKCESPVLPPSSFHRKLSTPPPKSSDCDGSTSSLESSRRLKPLPKSAPIPVATAARHASELINKAAAEKAAMKSSRWYTFNWRQDFAIGKK